MRIFLTGGTGLLGAALVARSLTLGHSVVATHLRQGPGDPRARWLRLDVTDADAVTRALAEASPDAVIHTAYAFQGEAMRAVTVGGAEHVAAVACSAGARLVHLSTDVVFDGERATSAAPRSPVPPVRKMRMGEGHSIAAGAHGYHPAR